MDQRMLEQRFHALEQKIDQLVERSQALQLQNQLLKEQQLTLMHSSTEMEKKKQVLRDKLQRVISQLKELEQRS
jgi:uncharacterized protein (TIGR02449 family)